MDEKVKFEIEKFNDSLNLMSFGNVSVCSGAEILKMKKVTIFYKNW